MYLSRPECLPKSTNTAYSVLKLFFLQNLNASLILPSDIEGGKMNPQMYTSTNTKNAPIQMYIKISNYKPVKIKN